MPPHGGHSHGGHEGCGGHGAAGKSGEEFGLAYSLYAKVDKERLECLNEATDNSCREVFRPWDQRLDRTKFVISDADEELLFNIPFTGNVKLKGLIVMGGEEGTHPAKVRLFKNRPHMTFDMAAAKADQEFDLVQDDSGTIEYAPKVVTFSSVHHLTLHFPSNLGGDDETKVYYIGLKGEFTKAERTGVVNAVYEARPMIGDHKADNKEENIARGPQC